MVFRRRQKLSYWQWFRESFWPRAGWRRAIGYIRHRIRRLPDTPEKIGRGIWCGVFASFTPLFGLHFILAIVFARVLRGNMLAAIIGTFAINPLTVVPVGITAMYTGYFMLGTRPEAGLLRALPDAFSAAAADLWHNVKTIFGPGHADWSGLAIFWNEVFFPYLVGGIIPGIIVATACYYLTVQLVRAYQVRRRNRLGAKLATLQKNPAPPP